ncbi:hypothetical protein [Segatella maculosa]|uniref:Lipocalin-like domain-containing protein n=1 Tax=Segatella maculosa OT 289 TaxID=999422 RepID=H1HN60_9BACT|nr:hypothetical protein [Segatella maculosa]EHO69747.1 hypothetical protein HMPREF9944_01604 [Segatella maculosa OT 289]
MKQIRFILAAMLLFVAFTANAQENKEVGSFFVGTWNITVKGTPNGDSNMKVVFKRNAEGKITGATCDDQGKETPFTRLEVKNDKITAYWVAQGYDVYLYLEKVADNKVEGSMMDMFDAVGTKVKEDK